MQEQREVVGRLAEVGEAAAVLERARTGLAALSITGPPGIGKTTVWREGVRLATDAGFRVLATRPTGAEATLSFAGLADLLRSVGEEPFEPLPRVQRRALRVALLQAEAEHAVDARAVAAALLSLLRGLAASSPVLVAVDDAQWLDAATAATLAFALRRLEEAPVAVVASLRTGTRPARSFLDAVDPERLTEVPLAPLSAASVHRILRQELRQTLPRPTLVRVTAGSGGNPFYALEIARELIRLGRAAAGAPLPIPREIQELVRSRVRRLPAPTRQALLQAAALAVPQTTLVAEAALGPAEEAGIVRVTAEGRIDFAHPLLAAAVYESAPAARRRDVHRELATRVRDSEERARHLALASPGPDADVAAELDAAAHAAAARGASDAAAELAELALLRTPPHDGEGLLRRRLDLGTFRYAAGDGAAAIEAFEAVSAQAPPGDVRARALIDLGLTRTAVGDHRGGVELIDAALAEIDDPLLAARAHARRAWVSQLEPEAVIAHCRAVLDLVDETREPAVHSFALQHLAYALLCTGREAAHDLIDRSLAGQAGAELWTLSSIGARWPLFFDDLPTARDRHLRLIELAGEQGNEPERQTELAYLGLIELWSGRPREGEALAREALDLAREIEQEPMACVARYVLGLAEAQLGRLDDAAAHARESLAWIGEPPADASFILATQSYAVLGFVALSRGDVTEADRWYSLADEATARWPEPAPFRFHGDHAEAVVRAGDTARATLLVERLERRAERIPRPWIRAVSCRTRGLLSAARGDLDGAVASLEDAREAHAGLEMPFELARTLLCLGEVRRRRKERRLARLLLEQAAAAFEAVDAPVWAERARAELARVPTRKAAPGLTATEARIAALAADGLTNRAIAERAFVTVNTVEANLGRVYRKLGISSRAQLSRALDAQGLRVPS